MRAQTILRLCSICLLTAAMGRPVLAQSAPVLILNGRFHSAVSLGQPMDVKVVGTPGTVFSVVMDVVGGPTYFGGHALPIGGSPFMVITHHMQVIPPNGVFNSQIPIAVSTAFQGIQFYAVAIAFNSAAPGGFLPSNGATGTFITAPDAGLDTAGMAGRPITLDGSGSRDAVSGQLHPSQTVTWSIVGGPPGHGASLQNPSLEFPTLLTNVPGTYLLRLSAGFPWTFGGASDDVSVSVHEFTNVSLPTGLFAPTPNVIFGADVSGPAFNSFGAPGIAMANGSHLGFVQPAGADRTQFQLELVSSSGQKMSEGFTIFNNPGISMNNPVSSGFSIMMRQASINTIAGYFATELAGYDLTAAVAGGAPVNIAYVPGLFGTATFSADVTLQDIRYAGIPQITLTPGNGTIGGSVTLQNLELDFWVTGEVFAINYSELATLVVNTATVNLDGTVNLSGGVFSTTANNINTSLSGVTLQPGGVITSFASLFTSSITPEIEAAISTTIANAFPTLMDDYLNTIPNQLDLLTTAGISGALDFSPQSIAFTPGAFRIDMAAGAHAYTLAPGAPNYTKTFNTPSGPPTMGSTSPNGSSYDFAVSVSDDALNQAGAAFLETGLMNMHYNGQLDIMGTLLDMNAGNMIFLFPGVGFEKFDPSALVFMNVVPTSPPVAKIGASNGDLGSILVSDLEVELSVELSTGVEIPVLTLGINGEVGLNISVDLTASTVEMIPGTTVGTAYAISTMPGVDAGPLTLGLGQLLGMIVPSMMSAIGPIPLPDLTGVGVGSNLVELVGQGDHAVLYTN